MKKNIGRPKKRPGTRKVKVTLSLDPNIYQSVKELCFNEGTSVSEKIDKLFEPLVQRLQQKGQEHIKKATNQMKPRGKGDLD